MQEVAAFFQHVVESLGYPGLFLLVMLESTLVPVPSTLVFPFAGFLAAKGVFSLPIVLAIYTPNVLSMTFLGKALRASLSVLVLFVFYAPMFGNKTGAFFSIVASLVATIAWFMMGNPYGIDNAYIALAVPLVVMGISNLFKSAPEARPVNAAGRSVSGGE